MPAMRYVKVVMTREIEVMVSPTDDFNIPTDAIRKALSEPHEKWTLLDLNLEVKP